MKRILATLTLTCVLAVPALVGEIPTCNPAPTAVAGGSGTGAGDLPTAGSTTDSSETDSGLLTVILLTLSTIVVP